MAYDRVNFVDGVTPLNAATLNKLDQAIDELDDRPVGGGGSVMGEWTYNVTVAEPPSSGQVRLDQAEASQNIATKVWVHRVTVPGADAKNWLIQTKAGDSLYLQDKDDASKWQLYTVSANAVDKTDYVEIPVTWSKGGTALTAQRIGLEIIRAGGGASLTYEGDWAAPTTYQDGDVVVKDGVAYLCVGGPTTTPPDPAPWGAAALAGVVTKRLPMVLESDAVSFLTSGGWADGVTVTTFSRFVVPDDYQTGQIIFRAMVCGTGAGIVTWKYTKIRNRAGSAQVVIVASVDDSFAPGAVGMIRNVVFASSEFQAGDTLRADLVREGANASDTMTGTLIFGGAWIEYQGIA